jgi:enoyl-CoA hydratase
MADYILYDVDQRVATITLNRPDRRNAQNQQFLEELNEAWEMAAADDEVRVILLRANGPHFSAGHDLSGAQLSPEQMKILPSMKESGLLTFYNWETKYYFDYSRRWRDIPKPSIAAVQGACIAGGLMIAWPCDLIIAAENARFQDPVILMGMGGVEYHAHTWEVGARKAKEMLFTAKPLDAHEAERRGMVNRIAPTDELDERALALALEIAEMHPHALAMAKRSVNQTLDIMGQYNALRTNFETHHIGHGSAWAQAGTLTLAGLNSMREGVKEKS